MKKKITIELNKEEEELYKKLKAKGFTDTEIFKQGLLVLNKDYFRVLAKRFFFLEKNTLLLLVLLKQYLDFLAIKQRRKVNLQKIERLETQIYSLMEKLTKQEIKEE